MESGRVLSGFSTLSHGGECFQFLELIKGLESVVLGSSRNRDSSGTDQNDESSKRATDATKKSITSGNLQGSWSRQSFKRERSRCDYVDSL